MKFIFTLLMLLPIFSVAQQAQPVLVQEAQPFPVPVLDLRPTQVAVGLASVAEKADKLKKMSKGDLQNYLVKHPVPVVVGPGRVLYMIDHHHLSRALSDLGVGFAFAKVVADWSNLDPASFWRKMQENAFTYLIDPMGRPLPPAALPMNVRGLVDDPFRSLAAFAREKGAYEKCAIPFAEFQWASYYRRFIPQQALQADSWKAAIKTAVEVSQLTDARDLPGYRGPAGPGTRCQGGDDGL